MKNSEKNVINIMGNIDGFYFDYFLRILLNVNSDSART